MAEIETVTAALQVTHEITVLRQLLYGTQANALSNEQREAYFDAKRRLELLNLRVCAATSADDLTKLDFRDELRQIAAVTAVLPRRPQAQLGGAGYSELWADQVDPLNILSAPWERVIDFVSGAVIKVLRHSPNWILFLIALLAALLVGYTTLYAGKPWGTVVDWATAFGYGAGAFVASLTLSTYFGDLGKDKGANKPASPSAKVVDSS